MGRTVVYAKQVARTSQSGHEDELRGRSEPDEPSYEVQVRRMWPYGLRSRPPAGVDAVAVGDRPETMVMVGAESPLYGPSDLAEGEVAIYATEADITAAGSGKVRVDSASAKDVVVNGGTKEVARKDDLVAANTTMAAWIAAVTTALANLGQTVTAPTDFGKISQGAARFKA